MQAFPPGTKGLFSLLETNPLTHASFQAMPKIFTMSGVSTITCGAIAW
jgi:hypothetical protein